MSDETEFKLRELRGRAMLSDLDLYLVPSTKAGSLRQDVRVALIANDMDATDEVVAHVAKALVSRDGASLLNEIEKLKSAARAVW